MDVQITIRRGRVGASFRSLAEEKARKLERYEPRLIRVELSFEEDAGLVRAETRCYRPGPTLVARAEGDSRRTALDRVMQRASRRLRKERSKRVQHQAPPATAVIE